MFDSSNDTPERRLIGSVILQAITDAFIPHTSFTTPVERWQAILFLTADSGPWAQSRCDLCDAIDFDSDVVRIWAVRVLEGAPFSSGDMIRDPSAMTEAKQRRNDEKVDAARRMWAEHKNVAIARKAEKFERQREQEEVERLLAIEVEKTQWNKVRDAGSGSKNEPPKPTQVKPARLSVSDAGFVYCQNPPDGAVIGDHQIPRADSVPGRILRALIRKRGATLLTLRATSAKYYKSEIRALARRHGCEVVPMTYEGLECTFNDAYRYHLRPITLRHLGHGA